MSWFHSVKPVVASCGHRTREKGRISALGEATKMVMPRNETGGFDYCLDCVAAMTIRCAWCGNVIFIGSPVTLYGPLPEFQIPEYAVVHSRDPLKLVGCLGWDCADSGFDRAGFWMPGPDGSGLVHRVHTAFEMMLEDPTIVSMMVNDLSDPSERPIIRRESDD